MSQETIERVVGRALLDRQFLEALLRHPDDALKDSALGADERAQVAKTIRDIGPADARRLADAFETQVATRRNASY